MKNTSNALLLSRIDCLFPFLPYTLHLILAMSLPLLFSSSPPSQDNNYYGVEQLALLDLDDDITLEEVDEDIKDQKARINQAFHYMKEELQKEIEGALAPKTISDYAR